MGTDDCREAGASIFLTDTSLVAGYSGGTANDIGLRWQSINIAQGTTITSAKLSLYLTTDAGSFSANIRGIDEDNTTTWSSVSRPSGRTKTTATITANEANWNNWGTDAWVDIDITSAIQEIVNRGGWSANNALAIVLEDAAGAGTVFIMARAYEYAGNVHGAKLEIIYGTGASSIAAIVHHLQEQGIS